MHEAVVMEKQALESRVSSLTQEVVDLQIKADHADRLQVCLGSVLKNKPNKNYLKK